jgi:hypothetical protein
VSSVSVGFALEAKGEYHVNNAAVLLHATIKYKKIK